MRKRADAIEWMAREHTDKTVHVCPAVVKHRPCQHNREAAEQAVARLVGCFSRVLDILRLIDDNAEARPHFLVDFRKQRAEGARNGLAVA